VCSSQPLASFAGLSILQDGGNCVDACVAVAAALAVTEPMSTGLGGDCFCLYFNAAENKVYGLNGSGRAPSGLSLASLPRELLENKNLPFNSVHAVTVPGAAAGWCDAIERWGSKDMATVLAPAIKLAEEGFPVSPICANLWQSAHGALLGQKLGNSSLTDNSASDVKTLPGSQLILDAELLIDGRAPVAGDFICNPDLAATMRSLACHGKHGFYRGPIASAVVEAVRARGGLMDATDLESHASTFPDPVSTRYHGVDVWEIPPNGQGLTALLALNILEQLSPEKLTHNSADYLHLVAEALRLAFADARHYIADPALSPAPVAELLSKPYAQSRAKLIDLSRAASDVKHGSPFLSCDTVSLCCVDAQGNACSFINSVYTSFGSGIVPRGVGFALQNRGCNFELNSEHANCLAPGKRPYHTIIPGLATKDGQLYCPFSVMGGFMQPQGHVQVILNMVDFGMDPQQALDSPRLCLTPEDGLVCVEPEVGEATVEALRRKGHNVQVIRSHARKLFGRGQIIRKAPNGVLWAGSDGRGDGCAVGIN
jgi:gamma-glutamyltranspeptidase/glutathione hydrolase